VEVRVTVDIALLVTDGANVAETPVGSGVARSSRTSPCTVSRPRVTPKVIGRPPCDIVSGVEPSRTIVSATGRLNTVTGTVMERVGCPCDDARTDTT
jgi:hypothetical protein